MAIRFYVDADLIGLGKLLVQVRTDVTYAGDPGGLGIDKRPRPPGPVQPGDIEIRFRKKSPLDVGELDVVIEVRTKLFGSRVADKQRRADLIRDRLSHLPLGRVGVWLILSEGAWSQN